MYVMVSEKKGQALIEFAFCVIILSLLVLGFTELGMAFWTSHAVANASREGARIAATLEGLEQNDADVQQAVRDYLERAALNSAGVEITNSAPARPGDKIEVVVSFPYQWITPLPNFLRLEALEIRRKTTMRYCPYRDGRRDLARRQPNFGDERPRRENPQPDFGRRLPDFRDRLPDLGERLPDWRNRRPDWRNRRPDFGDRLPDFRDRLPDFGERPALPERPGIPERPRGPARPVLPERPRVPTRPTPPDFPGGGRIFGLEYYLDLAL